MASEIRERQNEENNIAYLAAQRQIYSEVKIWSILSGLCAVMVPFLLSVAQIFADEVPVCFYVLSFISWGISYVLRTKAQKDKKNAAYIQQKFDVNVYQMPWDEYLFEKERNVSGIVAEKSEKIFHNELKKKELMDWYEIDDTLGPNESILACQRMNVSWDAGLRKRYKIANCAVGILLLTVIYSLSFVHGETYNVFYWIAFVLPLFQWVCDTVRILDEDIKRLNKLDELINLSGEKKMIELQVIQREIFLHRQSCYAIPNFFYKLFKKKDEVRAQRQAQLK